MSTAKNLIGQRFGKLTVLSRLENTKSGKTRWLCVCDCGKNTEVVGYRLTSGETQSCGCKKFESHNREHGMTKTDIHNKWIQMKQRCNNPNCKPYLHYGAVGIKVCDEWEKDFISFMNWSYENGYKEGMSLDRIDNSKGYSPENCRWISWKEQCNNRRTNINVTYQGKTQSLKKWCEELKLNYSIVRYRMHKYGMDFDKVVNVLKNQKYHL